MNKDEKIQQNNCKDAIDKCVKAGLINGFPDGTFRPSETISREQICTMFAKLLDK